MLSYLSTAALVVLGVWRGGGLLKPNVLETRALYGRTKRLRDELAVCSLTHCTDWLQLRVVGVRSVHMYFWRLTGR